MTRTVDEEATAPRAVGGDYVACAGCDTPIHRDVYVVHREQSCPAESPRKAARRVGSPAVWQHTSATIEGHDFNLTVQGQDREHLSLIASCWMCGRARHWPMNGSAPEAVAALRLHAEGHQYDVPHDDGWEVV